MNQTFVPVPKTAEMCMRCMGMGFVMPVSDRHSGSRREGLGQAR